jgi:hypothetical protein
VGFQQCLQVSHRSCSSVDPGIVEFEMLEVAAGGICLLAAPRMENRAV